MTFREATYGELSGRVHSWAAKERIPVNATVEVTHRCPMSCLHCYDNLPSGDIAAKTEELTGAEHRRLIDEFVEAGTLWLLYTGGEPFVRPDFPELYLYAKRSGLFVTIFTNATLLSERTADLLAEARPFSIEVTLYGATQATHEAITRVPGSFEACRRGVALLSERRLPLALKAVALRENVHELREMKSFAESIGASFKFDGMVNPRLDGSLAPLCTRLAPREVVALDHAFPERRESFESFNNCFLSTEQAPPDGLLYGCGGGISGLAVDPYGRMRLCGFSQRDTYDFRLGDVASGWKFLGNVRSRPASRTTKCTACGLKSLCGMCPANGELEGGDAEEPVDFLCRVAHLRAETFGWGIPSHGTCEYCDPGVARETLLTEAQGVTSGVVPLSLGNRKLPVHPIGG